MPRQLTPAEQSLSNAIVTAYSDLDDAMRALQALSREPFLNASQRRWVLTSLGRCSSTLEGLDQLRPPT